MNRQRRFDVVKERGPYAGQVYCGICEYRTVSSIRCPNCGPLCRQCREGHVCPEVDPKGAVVT